MFIYTLKLENNKYYVGKSNFPEIRINDHFNSNGSYWTKKYKPIEIIEIVETDDNFDEDKITLKLMNTKGIDNVRGGSFCQIQLNEETINFISKMISSSTDKCYICGNLYHFVKDCKESPREYIKESPREYIKESPREYISFKDGPREYISFKDGPREYISFKDGPCNCATSYFSKHRKSKCLLNKIINY